MTFKKSIKFPLILINLKSYSETIGFKAEELTKIAEEVADSTGVCIGIAPQYMDLRQIGRFRIPVFSQHIDPILPGAHTGHVLAESVSATGAVGAILNHSERRLELSSIEMIVERLRSLGLISVVCASSLKVAMAVASLDPDIVAIEPPELIGSGIAVSKAKPEVVSGSVEAIKRINSRISVLCGAGISSGSDVHAAIQLGTSGVLVASGIAKSTDWKKALLDLATSAAET